jgi:hypothetical protein
MLNKETHGTFLDVEGAFDAIPHYLLIHKLKSYGLSNGLINFLKSLLVSIVGDYERKSMVVFLTGLHQVPSTMVSLKDISLGLYCFSNIY